jgi:hypothetical protein
VALNKQAVSQMENDMERWLKEREKLSHKLEKLSQKKRRLLLGKKNLLMTNLCFIIFFLSQVSYFNSRLTLTPIKGNCAKFFAQNLTNIEIQKIVLDRMERHW